MSRGWKHGASAYASTTIRCRCDICRAASTERQGERIARLFGTPIPEGTAHGKNVYVTYGCRCDVCEAGVDEANRKSYQRERLLTIDQATNSGKEWTGPELEIVARRDLTAVQAALMLRRTVAAVRGMRRAIKTDPRKRRLAGLTREQEERDA